MDIGRFIEWLMCQIGIPLLFVNQTKHNQPTRYVEYVPYEDIKQGDRAYDQRKNASSKPNIKLSVFLFNTSGVVIVTGGAP